MDLKKALSGLLGLGKGRAAMREESFAMALEDLKAEWERLEEADDWSSAFAQLRVRSEEQEARLGLRSKDARAAANRLKNRYRDVLPYDDSRIRLDSSEDYINASLVPVTPAARRYILAQGPLPHTAAHFWAMVWEQKSHLVCMLNRLVEKNLEKCFRYYPTEVGTPLDVDGEFSISLEAEEVSENFVFRRLSVTKLKGVDASSDACGPRTVEHFQFTTWPDFGVPADTSQLLQFLLRVRRSGLLNTQKYGAAVIHCSAGIGRSGTFVILDSALSLLRRRCGDDGRPERTLDITGLAVELRRYRMGLIQTREQLEFTWRAVMDAVGSPEWAELVTPLECGEEAEAHTPELERSPGNALSCGDHSVSVDQSLLELRGLRKRANTSGAESPAPPKFSSAATILNPPTLSDSAPPTTAASSSSSDARAERREEMRRRLERMKAGMLREQPGWAAVFWADHGTTATLAAATVALVALALYHWSS